MTVKSELGPALGCCSGDERLSDSPFFFFHDGDGYVAHGSIFFFPLPFPPIYS